MRHALLPVDFEQRQTAGGGNLLTARMDYASGAAPVPECLPGKNQTGANDGNRVTEQKAIAPDLQPRHYDREFGEGGTHLQGLVAASGEPGERLLSGLDKSEQGRDRQREGDGVKEGCDDRPPPPQP